MGAGGGGGGKKNAEQTALAFKRDMGTGPGCVGSPPSCVFNRRVAMVLSHAQAGRFKEALGVPVEEAVITVPAYFKKQDAAAGHPRARREDRGAGSSACTNEPTAAASLMASTSAGPASCAPWCSTSGGGTFDVALLEIIEGVMESEGRRRLTAGGEDLRGGRERRR